MYEFHRDKDRYFHIQYLTAKEYLIPFIREIKPIESIGRVLEIGCAEAGVLKAFREAGCDCTGIELAAWRLRDAERLHGDLELPGSITFVNQNIYDIDPENDLPELFDLIILKDVIEHIPDQEKIMPALKQFLKPGGIMFFGFPPWYMPFGGHQQICTSKFLGKLPYWHLLPRRAYQAVLDRYESNPLITRDLMEIKDTGISIERFERIAKRSGFNVLRRKFWLLNPIYKYKFGKGPYNQLGLIGAMPYLRNFFTTAVYYILGRSED